MCCGAILKVLLYIFNACFFLTGIALITIGSIIFSDLNSYVDLIDHEPLIFGILFISIGCIVVVSTFFGCFDMCKKCGFLIFVYTAFLCCVFVLEAGTGIAAFTFRGDLNDTVTDSLRETIHNLTFGDNEKQWNNMQNALKCCGADAATDWKADLETGEITASCCDDSVKSCTVATAYTENCIDKAFDELDHDAKIFASIGVVFACIQICGIVITFFKGVCCCC